MTPRFSLSTLLIAMTGLAVLLAVMTPLFVMGVETRWLLILSIEAAFWVALLPVLWIALRKRGPQEPGADGEPRP